MTRILYLSFLALSLSPLLHAQGKLSLEEAVQIALRENLNIEMARQDVKIAQQNFNIGNAGFLPNIGAGGSYQWQKVDVLQELNVGDEASPSPPRRFNDAVGRTYQADVTASLVLFDGLGRINNYRRLELQYDMSETQLRMSLENILLRVFNAYFEVARQHSQLRIARESLEISQERFRRAQTAQELGSSNRLDALSALVDLRQDSIAFYTSLNRWQQSRRQLNLELNLPNDTNVLVDSSVQINTQLDLLSLRQQALQNNVTLLISRLNREISQKELNIARSQRLPQLSASGGYIYSQQENEGGFLRLQETKGLQYGLNARWDLLSSYRTQTQIETARIQVFKDKLAIEQAKQELSVELANAWQEYQFQQRVLRIESRNLSVAKLSWERSREAYRLGQASNLQVREAQLNYIRAKINLNDLRYQSKIAEIELQRIAGVLVQEYPGER